MGAAWLGSVSNPDDGRMMVPKSDMPKSKPRLRAIGDATRIVRYVGLLTLGMIFQWGLTCT